MASFPVRDVTVCAAAEWLSAGGVSWLVTPAVCVLRPGLLRLRCRAGKVVPSALCVLTDWPCLGDSGRSRLLSAGRPLLLRDSLYRTSPVLFVAVDAVGSALSADAVAGSATPPCNARNLRSRSVLCPLRVSVLRDPGALERRRWASCVAASTLRGALSPRVLPAGGVLRACASGARSSRSSSRRSPSRRRGRSASGASRPFRRGSLCSFSLPDSLVSSHRHRGLLGVPAPLPPQGLYGASRPAAPFAADVDPIWGPCPKTVH